MADRGPAARLSAISRSLFANAVLLPPATLGLAVLAGRRWRTRRGAGHTRGARPAIRTVPLADVDPVFAPHPEFGPTLDCEVRFVGRGATRVLGGASDTESWILAVLAKRARRLFEFGTCTGKTSYLWAVNAPADARVTTLTLAPEAATGITLGVEDEAYAAFAAARESVCTEFLYSGTAAEAKITQLFGDSKAFDETPYLDACDLVFVDGSHAYSYVVSDSEKAVRMVRPGGLVLWHDYYAGPDHVPDVHRALGELAGRLPLVHLEGTTLVAYRRPAA
jgi:predicted O-methyltransferase YrrM